MSKLTRKEFLFLYTKFYETQAPLTYDLIFKQKSFQPGYNFDEEVHKGILVDISRVEKELENYND